MNKLLMTVGLVAAIALAGCSTSPRYDDPQKSMASKLTLAAGFGGPIRDVEPAQFQEAYRMRNPGPGTVSKGLYVAANAAQGLSGAALGVMGVWAALSAKAEESEYAIAFGWLPKDNYSDKSAAAKEIRSSLLEPLIAGIPEPLEAELDTRAGGRYWINGPGCPRDTCRIYTVLGYEDLSRFIIEEPAPSFASVSGDSQQASYKFKFGVGVALTGDEAIPLKVSDRYEWYKAYSEKTPDYVYVYVPPNFSHAPYPVVFHQGKEYFFVKGFAEPVSPTTAMAELEAAQASD